VPLASSRITLEILESKQITMKIAMVAQPFDEAPPVRGGSLAIWCDEVAQRLAERHAVTIYCRTTDAIRDGQDGGAIRYVRVSPARDEAAIRFIALAERVLRKIRRSKTDLFYRHYYFTAIYYRSYISRIAREIQSRDEDLVLVHNFSQFVPPLRARLPDTRIVLAMHCDWLIELDRRVVQPRIEQVDGVTGCSRYIADGVARKFPAHAKKCFPLHNGCNLELFSEKDGFPEKLARMRRDLGLEGKTVVTFIGRVAPEKGVHVLIEAMKTVVAAEPDTVLVVVGGISVQPPSPRWIQAEDEKYRVFEELKTDYRRHLVRCASAIEDHVRFVGDVSHYDLTAHYNLADIFVHPAVWNEPFGMIITEAMACGRPVVSTRAGGIPEIVVDGETGLLADPGDPRSLADAVLQLVSDSARREAMGRAGRRRVADRFTWDHTAATFCRAVDRIVPRDSGPR
jgi:glycosyltransferase involved in cell wall biosynthesis